MYHKGQDEFTLYYVIETKELINQRHSLQCKKPLPAEGKKELSSLYKRINNRLKQEYKDYKLKKYEKSIEKTGGIKRAQKSLNTHKDWITNLHGKSMNSTNRKDILQIATNYYRELYKDSQFPYQPQENNQRLSDTEHPIFTIKDIVEGLRHLQNEKCPGPDGIINEALKLGEKVLAGLLCQLFNNVLLHKEIPQQWAKSEIILLYKKGDPADISNYRPISLLSAVYKLFSYIVTKKIDRDIDKNQPVEQAGFRSGFSTTDHLQVVSQLIEKHKEFNTPLYIAFVDYTKAFDSLCHEAIWSTLKQNNVNDTYTKIIQNIYIKTAKVK